MSIAHMKAYVLLMGGPRDGERVAIPSPAPMYWESFEYEHVGSSALVGITSTDRIEFPGEKVKIKAHTWKVKKIYGPFHVGLYVGMKE